MENNKEKNYWCDECKKYVIGVFHSTIGEEGVNYEVVCENCDNLLTED